MPAGRESECPRGGTHDRGRDRSRMAEPPWGSVHDILVRPRPYAQKTPDINPPTPPFSLGSMRRPPENEDAVTLDRQTTDLRTAKCHLFRCSPQGSIVPI